MSALYRLVYASENLDRGAEAEALIEVERILSALRHDKPCAGVTGALMFNRGVFVQALQGARRCVEETFERIQRDPAQGAVTVLARGLVFGHRSLAHEPTTDPRPARAVLTLASPATATSG